MAFGDNYKEIGKLKIFKYQFGKVRKFQDLYEYVERISSILYLLDWYQGCISQNRIGYDKNTIPQTNWLRAISITHTASPLQVGWQLCSVPPLTPGHRLIQEPLSGPLLVAQGKKESVANCEVALKAFGRKVGVIISTHIYLAKGSHTTFHNFEGAKKYNFSRNENQK